MNPSESFLYPDSYLSDMALFVTKSISHIFTFPARAILGIQEPSSLMKSDIPVIAAANDGPFDPEPELRLYETILYVLQRSTLDESVPVGMVVLLDLLGDMYRVGTYMEGDESKLVLPAYPHDDYIAYAMAAFMLSFRLLSNGEPVERSWETIMEGVIESDQVHLLETGFREFLEENLGRYPPPPILERDPAYKFRHDPGLPRNPFIYAKPYLRTKWAMYSHVRELRRSRGEANIEAHPECEFQKDFLLQFPPCYLYMEEQDIIFQEKKNKIPELWEATNQDVQNYLEAEAEAEEKELRLSGE